MPHSVTLITTIVAGFGLALLLGIVAVRLRLPALVGYLCAGVVIGPFTPGFVADIELSNQLAEIGVMLLMFGVGLHFSLDDLLRVQRIALPGALVQILVATMLGVLAASAWGWGLGSGIVFGLCLSVASTVVLLRALEHHGVLESINGRIAVGWLIVEDLVMVMVLVLLPPLAGWLGGDAARPADAGLLITLAETMGKIALFVALMFVVGKRVLPRLLWWVARTGSRELFTLCVVAAALGIAYGAAALFDASFALGAFFAGMIMRESPLSHRAADESLPLRDAFSVLFFVSVGMLFDPSMLVEHPVRVLLVVAIIVLGKSLAAFSLVLAFRYPLNTALTVSASLAQIGEFSFILAGLGLSLQLLSIEAHSLILAGALISIALNPLVFDIIEPFQGWIRSRSNFARMLEKRDDPLAELPMSVDVNRLTGHIVLVGYGEVGRRAGEALARRGMPIVVVEQNRETVESLRERDIPAVYGDAAEPGVLIQAHIARAQMLVVTTPDAFRTCRMIETARALRPSVEILARVYSDEEAELLRREGADRTFRAEHELALGMTRSVLEGVENQRGA